MISDIRRTFEQRKGQLQLLQKQLKSTTKEVIRLKKKHLYTERAQVVIQQVAKMTQEQLQYHVSEIVTLALDSVFPDPYELNLKFEIKRGKTEAEIEFLKDGEPVKPMDGAGGGACDIAAFALRVALWSLANPKYRNTLILDEPMRFVSKDLQVKASKMLHEISHKLGIQMIIVTHEEALLDCADKVFEVIQKRRKSMVTEK